MKAARCRPFQFSISHFLLTISCLLSMSLFIAGKTMELLRNAPAPVVSDKTETESLLTEREMEILKENVTGKNYKAIGEKLFTSPLTVRTHAANIYDKLHVNSRAQIINIAHKNKWIRQIDILTELLITPLFQPFTPSQNFLSKNSC